MSKVIEAQNGIPAKNYLKEKSEEVKKNNGGEGRSTGRAHNLGQAKALSAA